MDSSFLLAFTLLVMISTCKFVSGFGYKLNGNSQQNHNPGYYWNGFRPYAQPIHVETASMKENSEQEEDPEYMYELLFGHQIRDIEKYKRQQGCLCNNRLRDPHCGSDYQLYDNGCYFECAQKRNPGLKLLNWGKC